MSLIDQVGKVLVGVFGSANERRIRPMLETVEAVTRLEPKMRRMSDKALRAQTDKFRKHLREKLDGDGAFAREQADRALEDLLVEAFATVREAARRTVTTPPTSDRQPMRHFDVQLVGGLVLHYGGITEMVTGEGKTLVATLPAYLNALLGKGVHIVTVNDFLARRDRDWMGPMYEFLGMTAGAIQSDQDYEAKRAAYRCDVTFGYDSEFGFDYLRDNMRWSHDEQVQLDRMYYAIIDEVDSVLIDESRTPLIISGPAEESTEKYYRADAVARKLKRDAHFEVKEKEQTCHLTEVGTEIVERQLGVDSIYSGRNTDWPHHIEQALRAHSLYKRDVDYVVKEGEIIIVDEFTGRLMPGRRWSDGLHQAIEAKERLHIKEENQTLATITYQNFFRLYKKLAGMTGTALTEANEFQKIYSLDVTLIPTNRPLIRREYPDVVYRTHGEKWDAVEEEIVRQHATGRPLLVGTISIENSEMLSDRLRRRGIKHEVLNAKHHEREAHIIAKAGQLGNVTIATNMAGRGTDIVLGTFTLRDLLEHWKACDLAPEDLDASRPREHLEKELLEFWAGSLLDDGTLKKTPRDGWRRALEKYWAEYGMAPLKLCESVAQLGGLHIVGTERHEARRIDNQLRGRAGRQGDPGTSRFFVSLEDDVMRIFAGDRVKAILRSIGMTEGMAIESRMVSRAIERAQRKVEEHHFDMRKHLLEYDEVMDEQRRTIYGMRQRVLLNDNLRDVVFEMIEDVIDDDLQSAVEGDAAPETRSARPLIDWAREQGVDLRESDWRGAARQTFQQPFIARALPSSLGRPRERLARAAVSNVLNIACGESIPFCRWDLPFVARWARKLHARCEAEEMLAQVSGAVLQNLTDAAQRRYAQASPEEVYRRVVDSALEVYLPPSSVAAEDWDLRGLEKWGDALGVKISTAQWQRVETDDSSPDSAAADYTASRREEVRAWLLDRLPKQLRQETPSRIIEAALRHEAARLFDRLAREGHSNYRQLVNHLESAFDIGAVESDIQQVVQRRREAILDDLAAQLVALGAGRSDEEFARSLLANMLDTFLDRDLALPGRDFAALAEAVRRRFEIEADPFELSQKTADEIHDRLVESVRARYEAREQALGSPTMRVLERFLLLQKIDSKWKDHLYNMDHLKEGISLRAYGQLDPKVEYTREARGMFFAMLSAIRRDVADLILKVTIEPTEGLGRSSIWRDGEAVRPAQVPLPDEGVRAQQEAAIAGSHQGEKPRPVRKNVRAVGRNDPCPCGSGKKYKKCCGAA